jgi:uncharacterized protein YndB with AHSA1/START domain
VAADGWIETTQEGRVAATPASIWPLLDDPAAMGGWFAFADRMEHLSGAGIGRRQRLHGHWGGKRSEIDQEIVAYEPERTLAWRHVAERLDGKPAPRFAAETIFAATLVPDGDGTRVRLESRQRPATRLRGLIIRLFGRREVRQRLEQSLERLRERVAQA